MTRDPLAPPGDLDDKAKRLYRKLREHLRAQERWADSDVYVLGATCRYAMRARVARESLPIDPETGEHVMHTRGRSENSGDVAHPLVRIAETAERGFVDGLKELGLTPKAREQMKGEAAAPALGHGVFAGRPI